MTKQDYIKLANIIKEHGSVPYDMIARTRFIDSLVDWLKSDNPRFNEETFRKACE